MCKARYATVTEQRPRSSVAPFSRPLTRTVCFPWAVTHARALGCQFQAASCCLNSALPSEHSAGQAWHSLVTRALAPSARPSPAAAAAASAAASAAHLLLSFGVEI